MENNILEKRLEIWKDILFINIGASTTLLAVSTAELSNVSGPHDGGWYGVWLVMLFATHVPGFVLLWGKHWMQIPLQKRLNTIFGYFVTAWIVFYL